MVRLVSISLSRKTDALRRLLRTARRPGFPALQPLSYLPAPRHAVNDNCGNVRSGLRGRSNSWLRLEDLRQELLGPGLFGRVKEHRRSPDLNYFTVCHKHHTVSNLASEAHFVGNHHHGHTLACKLLD